MATSIFDDSAITPTDEMVSDALAEKKHVWDMIMTNVSKNFPDIECNWKFANKKAGWVLIFSQKKRTLFYFIPRSGDFRIALVFSDKAMKSIEQASLPGHIKEMISAATTCASGHSCFIDIKDEGDVEPILTLLKIKRDS